MSADPSLRILHVIGSQHGGGAERFYVRLLEAMAAGGMEVAALHRPRCWVAENLDASIPRFPVAMRNVVDLPSIFAIRGAVSRWRPTIVQSWMGRATRLTRLPKRKGVVHLARLGGFYKLSGYRHADGWIANTRAIRDYLVESGFPRERVHYIPNFVTSPAPADPVEVATLRRQTGIPDGVPVILALGRLVPKKGFQDLLAAFARLRGPGREAALIVLGAGPLEEELRGMVVREGAVGRVFLPGWQDRLAPWFSMADLFVCPSRHEPLGNVILEAWSHRLPVISTATHGAGELISPGENGVVVPVEDPVALGRAIERLLSAPAERQELAAAGHGFLLEHFSPARVVGDYEQLYRRLIG